MHPDEVEASYMSIPVLEFESLHQQIRILRDALYHYGRHVGCDLNKLNDGVNRSTHERQVLQQSLTCTCGLLAVLAVAGG